MRPRRQPHAGLIRCLAALLVCASLVIPPAPAAAANFPAGQSVHQFYNEVTQVYSNWTEVYGDNLQINFVGQPSGPNYTLGWRLPVDALAVNATFDITSTPGYKEFVEYFKGGGTYNTQGSAFYNTTSAFDLRYGLNYASPFALPNPAVVPADGFNTTSAATSVAVGDLDGDSLNDIAVLTASAIEVRYQRNGSFPLNLSFPTAGTPLRLFALDLNGDARTDLLGATRTTTNLIQVYPLVQLPGGSLRSEGAQVVMTGATQSPTDVAVGDLTGDGRPEVAFIFANRTLRWAEQFGGKNLDTWDTQVYTVDRTSANFNPRTNFVASAPANCSAVVAAGQLNGLIPILWQSNLTTFATLSAHTAQINGLAYAPNCNYLASVSSDGNLSLWVATTNQNAARVVAHNGAVLAVAFAPNGTQVATGGTDGQLKIWDLTPLPSPPVLIVNQSEPNGSILALEYSPDGSTLAVGTSNGTVELYETAGFTWVRALVGHTETIRSLAFTPDGTHLASASADDHLIVWDPATGTLEQNYTDATGDVVRARFSPNGTLLGAASSDGLLRVYRTDTWALSDTISGGNPFYGFDFGPSSDVVFGASGPAGQPSGVRGWDKSKVLFVSGWQTRQEFSVLSAAYDTTGRAIASASEDGTLVIVNSTTGARLALVNAHTGTANSVSWSPDGSYLASAGADGRVRIFGASNYSAVANITFAGNVSAVKFSPDSSLVAASSSTGNVSVWSTSTWALASNFTVSNQSLASLAWDPTSTMLVVGVGAPVNNSVRAYIALTGALVRNFAGVPYAVRSVDWSPDGTRIAAGGNGTNLFLWDAAAGTLLVNVTAHTNQVTTVAFSRDSLRVATGGLDRNIYTWNVATGALVQRIGTLPATSNEVRSIHWAPNGSQITVGWNDYRFPVARQTVLGGTGSAGGVAIGDVDNWYLGNELVATVATSAGGTIQVVPFVSGNPTGEYSTGNTGSFGSATKVAIGDFDGDGAKDDIAAISGSGGSTNAYFQQHNTTTGAGCGTNCWNQVVSSIFITQDASSLVVGDVTDDGRDDILIGAPALSATSNQLMVIFQEPGPTPPPSGIPMGTVSRYSVPVTTGSPSGVAVGDLNGDGLLDGVTANGNANSVWVFHQLDTLQGSYISPPLFSANLVGLPIVSALLEYDEQVGSGTSLSYFVSVNNGLNWYPVVRNESRAFGSSEGTQLRFRVDFTATRAGITAVVEQLWAHYVVQSVGRDTRIDVGNDAIVDWNITGSVDQTTRVTITGDEINRYIRDHLYLADGNGTIEVPFTVRWQRPGGYNFTNLTVPYNMRPPAPTLISPASGTYAPAQAELVFTAFDPDGEPLKYDVQVAATPDFTTPLFEYDQNISNIDWLCENRTSTFCLPTQRASKFIEDEHRLQSGQMYYWRVRVWDGQQWSLWSATWNFSVDDQPPEGQATSPAYAIVTQFTVSWLSVDAANGSGLAARPYDVQWKDGLGGDWVEWFVGTNLTSAVFANATNGHMYCFRMRATDAAGNQQTFLTYLGGDTCTTVDTDKPNATMDPLAAFQQQAAFQVSWSGNDGAGGSGVASYDIEFKQDNGSWVDGPQAFPGTVWTFVAQDDVEYCFRVAPRDRAGNLGVATNPPVCTQVDTSPPLCNVVIPDTTNNLTQVNVSWVCSDPQTGILGYEYSVGTSAGGANVLEPTAAAAPLPRVTGLSLLNDGTYFVNVRARNGAGAWSAWSPSNPMHVVIPGPVVTLTYPTGIWTTLNVTLGISIQDPLGFDIVAGDLQYRRAAFRNNAIQAWDDWRTVPIQPGSQDYLFEPLVRGYAYEFKYRARNEVGSWGNFDGNGTLVVNQLPVASTGGDRRVQLGDPVQLDASATIDYDGARDTLTYTWETDDGRTLTGPTATVSFDTPGVHRVLLKVDDTNEVAVAEIFVYVEEPEQTPYLPGFDGAFAAVALLGAAAVLATAGRRRRG